MVTPFKVKFWVMFIGILLFVLGVIGFILHDQCTTSVQELTGSVEQGLTEPMTIQAREAGGAIYKAMAEFFVAVLCPVLNFFNSLLGGFTFPVMIIVGLILIFVGWYIIQF